MAAPTNNLVTSGLVNEQVPEEGIVVTPGADDENLNGTSTCHLIDSVYGFSEIVDNEIQLAHGANSAFGGPGCNVALPALTRVCALREHPGHRTTWINGRLAAPDWLQPQPY